MYRLVFHLFITRMDAETAHHWASAVIRLLPTLGIGRLVNAFTRPDPALAVEALGLTFPSPLGVAAGFDKNAEMTIGLGQLGFGHVEVGTVTALAQDGNEQPRLFRLIKDRAIINRMGFNNRGADAAVLRLRKLHRKPLGRRPIIGVNIGKSRVVDVANAIDDYRRSAKVLAPFADYLVVNVSSPNTPGLRGLQELELLRPLLTAVRAEAGTTPLLLKIAPDLTDQQIETIVGLVAELKLDGIIATNTTIARDGLKASRADVEAIGAGGLSGAPLAARSLEVLRTIRAVAPADLCVISVGGVETAAQVRQRLEAGATLVQAYTAFIYRGPLWAAGVNRRLAASRRPGSTVRGTPSA